MDYEIVDEIEMRLRDGERLNVDNLVKEYFSDLPGDVATGKVYGRITTARKRMSKEGILVAPLALKTYGVPQTEEDYVYGHMYYKHRLHSNLEALNELHEYGQENNLLPEGMRNITLKLPSLDS